MTPRQELVLAASQQLRRWKEAGETKVSQFGGRSPLSSQDAIVAILDGRFDPGSRGEQMRDYYAGTSRQAHSRLLNEISSLLYSKPARAIVPGNRRRGRDDG